MSTKEILTKAKAILVERGVNRDGFYVNEKTGCEVCALGAVFLAEGGEVKWVEGVDEDGGYFSLNIGPVGSRSHDARSALEKALPESAAPNYYVPQFNDASQTDQEVIDLFDRAIALVSE